MTINIAVLTSEALVLGCDSVASLTEYFVDPFACSNERAPDGSLTVRVTPADIVQHVTHTWTGVTKMFPLQAGRCSVAAITAGLAKLGNRTVASYASQFYRESGGAEPLEYGTLGAYTVAAQGGFVVTPGPQTVDTVEEVSQRFLAFIRQHYDQHYADSKMPEEYRTGPLFLVGGYSCDEHLPSLFRVNVQMNTAKPVYTSGSFGLAWEGQSDAVERLIRGYDSYLRASIETQFTASIESLRKTMGEAAASMLQQVLDKAGIALPEGINTELPAAPSTPIPWDGYASNIAYSDLPLQDAIDLASFLVGLQSGKSKFARGVPTVGGRTHIGLITKHEGFRMLEEPQLRHTHVGFV